MPVGTSGTGGVCRLGLPGRGGGYAGWDFRDGGGGMPVGTSGTGGGLPSKRGIVRLCSGMGMLHKGGEEPVQYTRCASPCLWCDRLLFGGVGGGKLRLLAPQAPEICVQVYNCL